MKTDLRNKLAQVGTLIATEGKEFSMDASSDEIHITYEQFVSDEIGCRKLQTTLVVTDVVEEWE